MLEQVVDGYLGKVVLEQRFELADWPHVFDSTELQQVGVRPVLIDDGLWLKCEKCGDLWRPLLRQLHGRLKLRRNYWKCPNDCNT